MELQNPTDRIVKATLVHLVRKVPWGPSRDRLELEASNLRLQSKAEENRGNSISPIDFYCKGQYEDYRAASAQQKASLKSADELSWHSELYALAAAARFPRDDDPTLKNFVVNIVEDIRDFQARGYHERSAAMHDVSAAVAKALEAEGLELKDLPLPPTVEEMIDRGLPRPDYISEEQWNSAESAFYHQMTLDNTPAEFINGGGDYDGDYDDYDDYDDESDEEELRTDHEPTSEDREEQYRFREGWVEYLISTDCVPFVEEDGRVVRMEHGIVYLDDVDGSPLAAFVADNVRVGFDPEELATGKHREFETFKSSTPATA